MACQLNIKLLVASVHNLRVQLIFFDFIGIHFKKCFFCTKKFSVNVVISILHAFQLPVS